MTLIGLLVPGAGKFSNKIPRAKVPAIPCRSVNSIADERSHGWYRLKDNSSFLERRTNYIVSARLEIALSFFCGTWCQFNFR